MRRGLLLSLFLTSSISWSQEIEDLKQSLREEVRQSAEEAEILQRELQAQFEDQNIQDLQAESRKEREKLKSLITDTDKKYQFQLDQIHITENQLQREISDIIELERETQIKIDQEISSLQELWHKVEHASSLEQIDNEIEALRGKIEKIEAFQSQIRSLEEARAASLREKLEYLEKEKRYIEELEDSRESLIALKEKKIQKLRRKQIDFQKRLQWIQDELAEVKEKEERLIAQYQRLIFVYESNLKSLGAEELPAPPPIIVSAPSHEAFSFFVKFKHREPRGIGYDEGYTSAELFYSPSYDSIKSGQPFIGLRLHLFNDARFASNIGIGSRFLFRDSWIFGMNAYYDLRLAKKNQCSANWNRVRDSEQTN